MSLGTILIIVLVLVLAGVFPGHSYSRQWGYAPFSAVGVILIILVILILTGRL